LSFGGRSSESLWMLWLCIPQARQASSLGSLTLPVLSQNRSRSYGAEPVDTRGSIGNCFSTILRDEVSVTQSQSARFGDTRSHWNSPTRLESVPHNLSCISDLRKYDPNPPSCTQAKNPMRAKSERLPHRKVVADNNHSMAHNNLWCFSRPELT
jgi:hypothetical protein